MDHDAVADRRKLEKIVALLRSRAERCAAADAEAFARAEAVREDPLRSRLASPVNSD